LLDDIWEAIEKIERYTGRITQQEFFGDEKSIDAIVRNLEIIGEATNRLPEKFKNKYPHIEWKKVVGLRHRIVHDYFGIDIEIVWEILQKDLPAFKSSLKKIREEIET